MILFDKNKLEEKNRKEEEKSSTNKRTVLIVDDEKANLGPLQALLESEFHVLSATNGEEALEIVKNADDPEAIQVIISDYRMPGLSGVELFEKTIPLIPRSIRIIITGYADIDAVVESINKGKIYQFIQKPYDSKDLERTIKRGLESYDLETNNSKLLEVFEKFVPTQFLKRIAPQGIQHLENGKAITETFSILSSDIRSFTTLSESMNPQELLDFLNAYFRQMNAPIHRHHGFIDKFVGDGITALFDRNGLEAENHAQDAVETAIAMQKALSTFNQEQGKNCHQPIKIGIGVNTGAISIGTLGAMHRMDSTALGDHFEFASHLEFLTKQYGARILINESTYRLLDKDKFHIRKVGFVSDHSGAQTMIHEVCDADPTPIFEKKMESRNDLHQGFQFFQGDEPQKASEYFERCLDIYPQDRVVSEFIKKEYFNNDGKWI